MKTEKLNIGGGCCVEPTVCLPGHNYEIELPSFGGSPNIILAMGMNVPPAPTHNPNHEPLYMTVKTRVRGARVEWPIGWYVEAPEEGYPEGHSVVYQAYKTYKYEAYRSPGGPFGKTDIIWHFLGSKDRTKEVNETEGETGEFMLSGSIRDLEWKQMIEEHNTGF